MLTENINGWRRLWRLLEGGLAPRDEPCFWCGGRKKRGTDGGRRVNRYPAAVFDYLCEACLAGVPWIDRAVCVLCGRGEDCPDCARREVSYIKANRSSVRYTPLMKEWLARYKYRGSEKLEPLFAAMAGFAYERLREVWESDERAAGKGETWTVMTFVPLSRRRLAERGFNQAERLAQGIGRRYRVPVLPLLDRVRHTEKQSYKTRRERLLSLEDAFALREREAAELLRRAGKRRMRIVVADDVYTTGSTMQQCGRVLVTALGAGNVSVYSLTWAR